ncbi:lariocidin family lasso peptide [Photorhabdus caribbeanensis]
MKTKQPLIKTYGSFVSITLRKKSSPGDGTHARGIRRG